MTEYVDDGRRQRIGLAKRRAIAGLVLACGLCAANVGGAQQSPTPSYNPNPAYNRPNLGSDPLDPKGPFGPGPNPARMEKLRQEDRHKRILADTARLVELTNELKNEVDKASKDELSLNVVRKAAEIEKLAHDVKERMKS